MVYLFFFSSVLNTFCIWRNSSLSKLGKMFSILLKRNSSPSFIPRTVTFDLFMVPQITWKSSSNVFLFIFVLVGNVLTPPLCQVWRLVGLDIESLYLTFYVFHFLVSSSLVFLWYFYLFIRFLFHIADWLLFLSGFSWVLLRTCFLCEVFELKILSSSAEVCSSSCSLQAITVGGVRLPGLSTVLVVSWFDWTCVSCELAHSFEFIYSLSQSTLSKWVFTCSVCTSLLPLTGRQVGLEPADCTGLTRTAGGTRAPQAHCAHQGSGQGWPPSPSPPTPPRYPVLTSVCGCQLVTSRAKSIIP